MLPGNDNKTSDNEQDKSLPSENGPVAPSATQDEHVAEALAQAEHDIAMDPEFSANSPNDDLDEGETARLGEDVTDIV